VSKDKGAGRDFDGLFSGGAEADPINWLGLWFSNQNHFCHVVPYIPPKRSPFSATWPATTTASGSRRGKLFLRRS